MIVGQKRIIHRFIRPIADYEKGGIYYNQVIPIDTQAYAHYPEEYGRDYNLWYVFGDGVHTYTEIRDGKGLVDTAKEYPIFTQEYVESFVTYDKLYEALYENLDELFDNKLIAENIKYDYEGYDYKNVKEVLDNLLYKDPVVTLTGGGIYEKGTIVNSVELSWHINKYVFSQILLPDIGEIDNTLRNYTIENANISEDTTYTLITNDGKTTVVNEAKILFKKHIYYGSSANLVLTNSEILNFSKNFETITKATTTFDCSGKKYIYFVIPVEYTDNISFKTNGFIFNDFSKSQIQLINESGYESEYTILRSNNIQTYSNIEMEYCL